MKPNFWCWELRFYVVAAGAFNWLQTTAFTAFLQAGWVRRHRFPEIFSIG